MNSKQEMDKMFTKMDYIEDRCRRTNILIDGIADERGENWSESEMATSGTRFMRNTPGNHFVS